MVVKITVALPCVLLVNLPAAQAGVLSPKAIGSLPSPAMLAAAGLVPLSPVLVLSSKVTFRTPPLISDPTAKPPRPASSPARESVRFPAQITHAGRRR